ncbi:MAG: protein kinase, partial [Planctomycetota bacterium]
GICCRLCRFEWLPLTNSIATTYWENHSGKLGALAVHLGFISTEQLQNALQSQQQKRQPLGQILISMGLLQPLQLDSLLLLQKYNPRYIQAAEIPTVDTNFLLKTITLSPGEITKSPSSNYFDQEALELIPTPISIPAVHPLFQKGQIAQYRLLKLLGKGGMGEVFQAEQGVSGKICAIKVLSVSEVNNKKAHQRFHREIKSIVQLIHPNIVALLDYGIEEGYPYLVMEFLKGETLKEYVCRKKKLSIKEIRSLLQQLLEAMAFAHKQHIIHRDLKPSNLMMDEHGTLKVMDFGLSKKLLQENSETVMDTLTEQGTSLGTPLYMSPEQIIGDIKKIDHRTDLYAVGMILYELLTGNLPFSSPNMKPYIQEVLHKSPPPPSSKNRDLEPFWDVVCLKALAKEKTQRFSSAKEMLQALGPEEPKTSENSSPPLKPQKKVWTLF